MDWIHQIRMAFREQDFEVSLHARTEMFVEEIRHDELVEALSSEAVEILEDYANDPRGHSCLAWAMTGQGVILHAVLGLAGTPLKVITVYLPTGEKFYPPDFKRRRR